MKNLFDKKNYKKIISYYKKQGIGKDLAERIYTSRLLGYDSNLVLHGGGNTSVKSKVTDLDEKKHEVLYIKGSGSDLSTIGPEGFPAVKIAPIIQLLKKEFITDVEMVQFLRKNLIDVSSPNPSVETFVHAIINNKFVDHTHSSSLLEIMNRPDGLMLCKELYEKNFTIIPYVMPGYLLAREVYKKYSKDNNKIGLILFKHGIFTYGDTGYQSYKRMINSVNIAENFLKKEKSKRLVKIKTVKTVINSEDIAPVLRKYVSKFSRYILNYRSSKDLLSKINNKNIESYLKKGVITPDHVIRIKPFPLVINIDKCKNHQEVEKLINTAFKIYEKNYKNYFNKNININKNKKIKILDPIPQVIYIQNMGMFSVGRSLKEAKINGDIAELSLNSIINIEQKSIFKSISPKDIFDVEYWTLEQAKLNKKKKILDGKVVIVTGGAGTIGQETAKKFHCEGAEVIIIDNDRIKLQQVRSLLKIKTYLCDVTSREAFKATMAKICKKYGGIDIVVSNAGFAYENSMVEMSDKNLKNSFNINFFSHQIVASEATKIFLKQNIGGCLLFNISKQAINPGKNFGAYGTAKSALLALCKQYALEYGSYGIRSNGVNADRIVGGLLTDEMVKRRSKARKVSDNEYLRGNLLKREVFAHDVANAFFHLSISEKTTASVLTVDGGNIEASLR